jgi:hypothetical protein
LPGEAAGGRLKKGKAEKRIFAAGVKRCLFTVWFTASALRGLFFDP